MPVIVKSSHCSNITCTYLSHLVVTWKHEWRPHGNNMEKSFCATQDNFEPLGKCMDNTRAHLKLGNHLGQLGNCLDYTWGQLWYFGITWLLLCDICPVGREAYNHILHPWYFLMLGDKQDPSHRPSAVRTKPWLHTGRLRDQLYGCQRKDNSMAGTKHLLWGFEAPIHQFKQSKTLKGAAASAWKLLVELILCHSWLEKVKPLTRLWNI